MSVAEILHQIEALPTQERRELIKKVFEITEADVPDAMRQRMNEARRRMSLDYDNALQDT